MSEARVVVSEKGWRWAHTGHPWIYRDDITELAGADGEMAAVADQRGRWIGRGMVSLKSRISVRLITRGHEAVDDRFLGARLEEALARRSLLATQTQALRLIHGEADGFPALVVDRYGEALVVQATAPGAERLLDRLLPLLLDRTGARRVVARHDVVVRRLEGLPLEVRLLHGGETGPLVVDDDGFRVPVDVMRGQKTGLYLDQRDNRRAIAALGPFGSVLDLFTYQGGFALALARHAEEVVAVDSSGEALARAEEAARLNGIENVRFVRAKVFEDLRERERRGERYDLVIVDPPAFAKSRRDLENALRGYRELNERAMRMLKPEGRLLTSSCSYNLSEPLFHDVLRAAAATSGSSFLVVGRGGQAHDHPVHLSLPESAYLKTALLRRLAGTR
ncbi:MAG: class I SAM-dependent rRNA methyltransferase [Planctomycetota bacterium]